MFAERMNQLGTESAFEVFAQAKRLEAQGRSVIHLEIGQPDFKTAASICDAAYRAMQAGYTGYGPAAGLPELRSRLADHVGQSRQVSVQPEEVVVMPGAKPVIFLTLLALIEAGDEVIYPNPGFPIYESVINFVGGRAVPLPLSEELDFRFRAEDLTGLISDRTKLLILNSPHNPTGSMLTLADLAVVADLAQRHNFLVLADEIYARITYEAEPYSILSLPGMKERTILLDGFSKAYAMTGWRLGYAVAPAAIAARLEQLAINSYSCAASFTQMAAIEALNGPQDSVQVMVAEFRQRRDRLVAGLNQIPGCSCRLPQGAFYAFVNVKALPLSDRDLAQYLLEKAGVAVLAGSSFGRFGEGYLRLSYASSMENLELALEQMRRAIAQL
jgi:aspartate aminotransferase